MYSFEEILRRIVTDAIAQAFSKVFSASEEINFSYEPGSEPPASTVSEETSRGRFYQAIDPEDAPEGTIF